MGNSREDWVRSGRSGGHGTAPQPDSSPTLGRYLLSYYALSISYPHLILKSHLSCIQPEKMFLEPPNFLGVSCCTSRLGPCYARSASVTHSRRRSNLLHAYNKLYSSPLNSLPRNPPSGNRTRSSVTLFHPSSRSSHEYGPRATGTGYQHGP